MSHSLFRPLVVVVMAVAAACAGAADARAQSAAAPLDPVIQKLGEYVASYGPKASVIVAVEKYTQSVRIADAETMPRPRQLVAEFAIVKAGNRWVGYRDVVQVNNDKVSDRRDRLEKLLTDPASDASEIIRIANESARYNIGPVATNLNVPTTTLFFFEPANLHRFTFTRNGTKKVEGVETVEFAFKETVVPTMVVKRDGTNVPVEGVLWISPADGAVIRTRLRMRGFSDTVTTNAQDAPASRPAVNPNTPTGARPMAALVDPIDQRDIKSVADIDVTYARESTTGLWLPSKMAETYEGPIKMGARPPFQGMSTTRATYSDYKQFGTGATIRIPKTP